MALYKMPGRVLSAMSYEVITVDALKGFIAPVHLRMLLHELGRREWPKPEWARAHPIQGISINNSYTDVEIIDPKDFPKGIDFKGQVPMTFGGIPLRIDPTVPDDVIEFYQGTELVGRIFNLAKPPGL